MGFLMGTRHSFPQSQVNSYWFSEARWSQLEQISAGQRNALEDGFSMEDQSRAFVKDENLSSVISLASKQKLDAFLELDKV